jgi:hypothetical protein
MGGFMGIVDLVPILAERALAEARGRAEPASRDAAPDLKGLVEAYERKLILGALAAAGGHQRNAAARLGVLPSTLHEKMKRLGVRLERVRSLRAPASGNVRAALLWRGVIPRGGTLEVRGLTGRVRIDASEDDQVEVAATHGGPRAARAAVEVQVVEHRQGLLVCAVCPRAESGAATGAATGAVELVARVPPGVHVIASTNNGDVELVGVSGNVEAGTTNGHVIFLPATG